MKPNEQNNSPKAPDGGKKAVLVSTKGKTKEQIKKELIEAARKAGFLK